MAKKGDATRERILSVAEALVYDRGYAGTSLDEIIERVGVTKGGFFYHFKSKSELAQAVVERYAQEDYALFARFSERAALLADDPLQDAVLFFKLFEEFVEGLSEPLPGCIFASYTYEREQFTDGIHEFIQKGFDHWGGLFEEKFEALIAARKPTRPVTAKELTEAAMCSIEGGILLSKVYGDPRVLARQSAHFRSYLQLLFAEE